MKTAWTAAALRDLAALRAFIARDNPSAADRQVNIIVEAAFGLAQFPHSGRAGRRAISRELIVGRTPYLVPYRVRGETIDILRVLHVRQPWPDRF